MIKLKDLLTENREGGVYLTHKGEEKWFPAHTRRTLSQLMPGDRVALYPKLMNSVIGKQKVSSFHVSDLERYKGLKKVIGKKKSISTFSHVGKGSGLDQARGIQTMGGLAFHIEGFLLGRSWDDIMSTPDKTGRRWVNIEKVVGEDSDYAFRGELEKKKLTREDYNERLEKATKHLQDDERSYLEVQKDVKKITFKDGKHNEESLFSDLNIRLRNIQASPSGIIYLLTDGPGGKLIKVIPKDL